MRELFLIILVLLFSFGSFVLLWRHKSYNAFFQFMKWDSFVGKLKARRRFSCNKLERETELLTKYVRQKVFLQRDKCVCPCTQQEKMQSKIETVFVQKGQFYLYQNIFERGRDGGFRASLQINVATMSSGAHLLAKLNLVAVAEHFLNSVRF